MFLVFRSVHCIVKYRSIHKFVPLRTREMADVARCNARHPFFVCWSL